MVQAGFKHWREMGAISSPIPTRSPRRKRATVVVDTGLGAVPSLRLPRLTRRESTAEAVAGGKVHVGGQRCKPAHLVRPGELLRIQRGPEEYQVTVAALSRQRGPTSVATLLYEETAESIAAREHARELRKLAATPGADLHGRPTKRDRRRMDRFGGH